MEHAVNKLLLKKKNYPDIHRCENVKFCSWLHHTGCQFFESINVLGTHLSYSNIRMWWGAKWYFLSFVITTVKFSPFCIKKHTTKMHRKVSIQPQCSSWGPRWTVRGQHHAQAVLPPSTHKTGTCTSPRLKSGGCWKESNPLPYTDLILLPITWPTVIHNTNWDALAQFQYATRSVSIKHYKTK